MKYEINALCYNILCIILENGFKPKDKICITRFQVFKTVKTYNL